MSERARPPGVDSADLPARLAARPRDRRGLPIPPVNLHPDPATGELKVDFTTINTTVSTALAAERQCSLCAGEIGYWGTERNCMMRQVIGRCCSVSPKVASDLASRLARGVRSQLSDFPTLGPVQLMLVSEACRPRGATMALTMTKEEREAFLADVHVAVISVAEDGHGPLVVPIWYSYEPGGEVRIITGRTSRKGELLERAGRFSLCVQTETLPYKYVSVEGPIVSIEAADLERDGRPLARRYLGTELGDQYIEDTRDVVGNVLFRMRPERWLTVDYAKHPRSQ